MSKIYSHSSLSSFEQCPYKFKLRYIDKIKPEVEKTIEAHLGEVVHSTLEWIYKLVVEENIIPTPDQTISTYSDKWVELWKPEIKIINGGRTKEDYFNEGLKFLINYYTKYQPFQDGTLECEKKILLDLDKEKEYKIVGYIDRLAYNEEKKRYEIHDYKTSGSLPLKEKIDNDRQLALYSIAIKELFGKDKNIALIWHYLAYNKKIISYRTNQQLEQLKQDTIELIEKIEQAKEELNFPTKVSKLCDWCEYKNICPEFNKNLEEENSNNQEDLDEFPTIKKYLK